MKPSAFSFQLSAFLVALALAVSASAQQPTNVQKGGAAGTNNITADLYFPAARELRLSGIFSGTPASGTLNLSNLTLTLPAATSGLFQPIDADLTSWASVTRASGFDTFTATPSGANLASLLTTALPASKGGTGLTALAANVVTLLGAADYSAMRTQLGLVIGTNVQAYDADLDDLADGSLTGTKVAAATTGAQGASELATTAEMLAGTSTTLVPPVSAVEARVRQGDFTRGIRDALYSDGSTNLRRVELTPGTAGAVAAMPISIPFEFQVSTSNPSASVIIAKFGPTANPVTATQDNSLNLFIDTSGGLSLWEIAVGTGNSRRLDYAGFRAAYSGRWVRGMVVFASADSTTAPVIYLQGVDATASFTASAPGTPPNWIHTALDTTRFYSGAAFTADRFIPHAPILGALTAAEVLEWTQTGRLPAWCEIGTGSAVGQLKNTGFETGVPPLATGWLFGIAGASTSANVAGAGVSGGNAAVLVIDGSNSSATIVQTHNVVIGRAYRLVFTAKVDSTSGSPVLGSDIYGSSQALTTSFATYEVSFVSTIASTTNAILKRGAGCAGRTITIDNVQLYDLGPIAWPIVQPGVALRDAGTNNLPGILTSGITPITMGDRGAFTATLTWSGTHEGKSLLGTQAIPSNAIITRIWRKATVASSGSGCTIGTTTSATRWQALDTYTTAAEIVTLANQLPAGTAANDLDIVVDPDTANYTGSITVTVEYQIVGGTP